MQELRAAFAELGLRDPRYQQPERWNRLDQRQKAFMEARTRVNSAIRQALGNALWATWFSIASSRHGNHPARYFIPAPRSCIQVRG